MVSWFHVSWDSITYTKVVTQFLSFQTALRHNFRLFFSRSLGICVFIITSLLSQLLGHCRRQLQLLLLSCTSQAVQTRAAASATAEGSTASVTCDRFLLSCSWMPLNQILCVFNCFHFYFWLSDTTFGSKNPPALWFS